MIYGAFKARRGACCVCGATDRALYVMQCEPGKQPRLELATPGNPDVAACSDCWLEVGDIIAVRFAVPA